MKILFLRNSLHLAIGFLLMATVCSVLPSCSGGCSREKEENQWVRPDEVLPEDILANPVPFDEQSILEMAQLVNSGRTLTRIEIAQAIVVAEAATNHLGQILDNLVRNEDDADSWHVISEMAAKGWPKSTMDIVTGLSDQSLDATENDRLADLYKSMEYNHTVLSDLAKHVRNLPELFSL